MGRKIWKESKRLKPKELKELQKIADQLENFQYGNTPLSLGQPFRINKNGFINGVRIG
jgi:hypothetical protein